jgi:hypothetical protein
MEDPQPSGDYDLLVMMIVIWLIGLWATSHL